MPRYVAFLRGMNLGRRRIRNPELCACFEAIGFTDVEAFLASGNVVFDARSADAGVVARGIEGGLRTSLRYDVPTFLRTAAEVRAIAASAPFTASELAGAGKPQVAMLHAAPDEAARSDALGASTDADRLVILGRELHWLPRGPMSDSELNLAAVERAVGRFTIRTRRTVDRIAVKYLG